MADGLNQIRAIRISEILMDFRNIQNYLARIEKPNAGGDNDGDGYRMLRQCVAQSQKLFNDPNLPSERVSGDAGGDEEAQKAQLRQVILDASSRRFEAEKLYLTAAAATRWIQARAQILGGQRPSPANEGQLRALDNQLRSELYSITDQRVVNELRRADEAAGKWIVEDPSLIHIQAWIMERS